MTAAAVSDLAAFGGGLVSFLSPCVLPLVPAYLSMVTGLDVAQVADGGHWAASRRTPPCSSAASAWCSCCSA